MKIKELRLEKHLTQREAASLVGISLRTYQNHEYEIGLKKSFLDKTIVEKLTAYEPYSPEQGIYAQDVLIDIVLAITHKYSKTEVSFLYLFGSYAKNKATPKSDVDLLFGGSLKGLDLIFFEGELSEALHKKVDLLKIDGILKDPAFLNEILATGIKIYG